MKFKDFLLWIRLKFCYPLSITYFIGPLVYGSLFSPRVFVGWLGAFLLITSGSLMNDARDYHEDMNNPKKKNKPLQKGIISPETTKKTAFWVWLFGSGMIFWLMLFNHMLILPGLGSIGLPVLYFYGKDKPPLDLVCDLLLLPLPVVFGFGMCGASCPPRFLVGLLVVCTLAYGHDMLYDLSVDKSTTLKVLYIWRPWVPHAILIGLGGLFVVVEPTWVGWVVGIGYNAVFYYVYYTRRWQVYVGSTILIPGLYLVSQLLNMMGVW